MFLAQNGNAFPLKTLDSNAPFGMALAWLLSAAVKSSIAALLHQCAHLFHAL